MNKVVGIYDHDKQHDIFYELSGADGKNVMHGVLYYFGVLSGLRIGDILEVTVEQIGPLVSVLEQKTGKKKEFTLDACSLMLIECYIDHKGLQTGDRLFPVSRQTVLTHFKRAAGVLGLDKIGTHTMRKTYG